MTRPRSHDTDELAKRIFASLLPSDWQQREQHPDYRIDYLVEIFEQSRPSGRTFAVQLKGTESLKQSRQRVSFRFETEHLEYYLDCVQHPVFLVCIDVVNKRGYWCFLQGYALDFLNGQAWRAKKTVTIRMPKSNTLTDISSFRAAIESAYVRMASLHPAALPAAMQDEVQRLESLDPRFRIRVEADSQSGINYICDAQETVETQITLRGDPETIFRKHEDFINRGLPVSLDPGEFEVKGSPLWEHATAECGTIHWKQTIAAILRLRAEHSDKTVDFSGTFEGGLRELRFSGHSPGGLIALKFTLVLQEKPSIQSLTFRVPPTHWAGKRVRQLPGLQLLAPFCEILSTDNEVKASILMNGLEVLSGKLSIQGLEAARQRSQQILALKKAAAVAHKYGIDPLVPAKLGRDEVAEIERLHGALEQGEHCTSGSNMRVTLTLPVTSVRSYLESKQGTRVGTLKVPHDQYPFLGELIDLGALEQILTHAKLEGNGDDLLRECTRLRDSDLIELAFVGTPESLWILRLPTGRTCSDPKARE